MVLFDSNPFRITTFIFILVVSLIILLQPSIFFDSNGQFKVFGFEYTDETTPIPFTIFIYGFLIGLYLLILLIDSKLVSPFLIVFRICCRVIVSAT